MKGLMDRITYITMAENSAELEFLLVLFAPSGAGGTTTSGFPLKDIPRHQSAKERLHSSCSSSLCVSHLRCPSPGLRPASPSPMSRL